MIDRAPVGVLLLQLGTPDSPSTSDVRKFLREFLSDPRVLDMPAIARTLLLNTMILPFRPRRSAKAYRQIWTDQGSPLLIHTKAIAQRVQDLLGGSYRVTYAMRYRNPPISGAVDELVEAGCGRIVVLPMFPQYASAAGGSAIAEVLAVIGGRRNVPDVTTLRSFHDDPGFIGAAAEVARPLLDNSDPDHILFSYHGLPEKQVQKSDATGAWCLRRESCCDAITVTNRFCYRAQCLATSRALAAELGLVKGAYSTTFQSRLAGQKWIGPQTDKELPTLYASGVRRLAIVTPSFTADCLETLEEIGIRGRRQWSEIGGEGLLLIPCVNATPSWAQAIAAMVLAAS